MPRTKLTAKYSEAKRPPVDWLRAAILERQAVLGYSLKQLSKVGGVSYDRMRHLARISPMDWPSSVRDRICKELGVELIVRVSGMPEGLR